MSGFGGFLNKLAGKVMNAANSSQELMCLGKCDKITKHINISYTDYLFACDKALCDSSNSENDNSENVMETFAVSIGGTVNDLVPLMQTVIGVGNPYACIHCNKIRVHGGLFSISDNKKTKSVYLQKR